MLLTTYFRLQGKDFDPCQYPRSRLARNRGSSLAEAMSSALSMSLGRRTWPGRSRYSLIERNVISSRIAEGVLEVVGGRVLKEIFCSDHRSSTLRIRVFDSHRATPAHPSNESAALAVVQYYVGEQGKQVDVLEPTPVDPSSSH